MKRLADRERASLCRRVVQQVRKTLGEDACRRRATALCLCYEDLRTCSWQAAGQQYRQGDIGLPQDIDIIVRHGKFGRLVHVVYLRPLFVPCASFVEANRHASKSYFALPRSPSLRAFVDIVDYVDGKQQKRFGSLLVEVATLHNHDLA